jgi:hypothetical protein
MTRSPDNQSRACNVGELISDKKNTLAKLVSHASILAAVESLLISHVDADLSAQFQVAAMRQDRLVLLTPSAPWATRLRMQTPQILGFLQNTAYSHIAYIDIRVAPLSRDVDDIPVKRHLSSAAELALSQMSHILGDPEEEQDS